jgi:hypothetical protein
MNFQFHARHFVHTYDYHPRHPHSARLYWLSCLHHRHMQVRERHSKLLEEHHQRFHKVWGQLMKTGYQNSRFAHQVERFACLYTSHVSNLSFYSPNKSYRCVVGDNAPPLCSKNPSDINREEISCAYRAPSLFLHCFRAKRSCERHPFSSCIKFKESETLD